jgi:hypothetical protein
MIEDTAGAMNAGTAMACPTLIAAGRDLRCWTTMSLCARTRTSLSASRRALRSLYWPKFSNRIFSNGELQMRHKHFRALRAESLSRGRV